jgi:hypothetical protein
MESKEEDEGETNILVNQEQYQNERFKKKKFSKDRNEAVASA